MIKTLSCKFQEEVVAALEAEAERRKITVSDVLRWAVEAYFNGEGARTQNMKMLMFEIIKTRAVMMRVYDPEGTMITQEVCEQAGKDAAAYLEKMKNGKTA